MKLLIKETADILDAVKYSFRIMKQLGFSKNKSHMFSTGISELARNMLVYACQGEVALNVIKNNNQCGLEAIFTDNGPGIENIDLALTDHYSTGDSLGIGLPGTRRLADEFELESTVGKGTKVVIRKWL